MKDARVVASLDIAGESRDVPPLVLRPTNQKRKFDSPPGRGNWKN
ncbi:hypothetical protein [Micromonospora sp. WMMD812]|nr:hypothetical protein [Micromonospora sp. WMMD812]WBB69302.1 hypothetical protein O7603_08105 [Micromonospora sp. WMMD812]